MPIRSPQGIHRLSPAAIKYIVEPGWHADGGGLYLEVGTNGRKRWASLDYPPEYPLSPLTQTPVRHRLHHRVEPQPQKCEATMINCRF